MWDACEALLKASLAPKEDAVLGAWVRGWRANMPCFPRLHVITAAASHARARSFFRAVPNVTLRDNDFPPRVATDPYRLIQIHIMWADNFTAPHTHYVLFFDVDAVPVLPLRCHLLFDDDERLLLHGWNRNASTGWVEPVTRVFARALSRWGETFKAPLSPLLQGSDFMTFWPIVAPRPLLPEVRRLVSREYHTYFDDAFATMSAPSHSDLLGKAALLLHPQAARHVPCPPLRHATALPPPHDKTDMYASCFEWAAAVEHVRHPLQGCHTSCRHFKSYSQAADYAHLLLNQSAAFVRGEAPLPPKLWHYRANRSEGQLQRARAFVLRDDPGRTCGLRRGHASSAWRAGTAPPAESAVGATVPD